MQPVACPLCPLGELLLFPFFALFDYLSILSGFPPCVKAELPKRRSYYHIVIRNAKGALPLRKLVTSLFLCLLALWLTQGLWAHRNGVLHARGISCQPLLPLGITCEERTAVSHQLDDLQPGDLLVTFSTHTLGWRHGHAALVMDSETVLEAAMPGTVSGFAPAASWMTYSSLLHLRVRNVTTQQQRAVAAFARANLSEIPYGFFSGLSTEKAPSSPSSLQCAYLPWYAWQRQGVDLDSDGGRLVTVLDLAQSPLLEIIQSW